MHPSTACGAGHCWSPPRNYPPLTTLSQQLVDQAPASQPDCTTQLRSLLVFFSQTQLTTYGSAVKTLSKCLFNTFEMKNDASDRNWDVGPDFISDQCGKTMHPKTIVPWFFNIVFMGQWSGLDKNGDTCGKTMDWGTIDRGFTVIISRSWSELPHVAFLKMDDKSGLPF